MEKHNIGVGLINVIESLYDNNSNAMMSNTITLEWSQSTVGVGQGCILSPCLFNIFLEEIMTAKLENFFGTVKIAGREVTTLRFADDIDLLAGSREELADPTSRLDSTAKNVAWKSVLRKVRRWLHQELPLKGPMLKSKWEEQK